MEKLYFLEYPEPKDKKFKSIVGYKRAGSILTVISYGGRTKDGSGRYRHHWICKCECGNNALIMRDNLMTKNTNSCGCLIEKNFYGSRRTHGLRHTDEYKVWCGVKRRCYNKNEERYSYYGGRGIGMSDVWKDSALDFVVDMGRRPSPNHWIERYDNDGDYCFENCYWATIKEQANNKSNNRIVYYNDVKFTVAQCAEKYNISAFLIYARLDRGWTIEEALFGKGG